VAGGTDPSEARKTNKADRTAKREAQVLADAGMPGLGTFEHVAREWLTTIHEGKVSEGHSERTRIRLEQEAFPWLGLRPIAEIEAPELLQRCCARLKPSPRRGGLASRSNSSGRSGPGNPST